MKVAIFLTLALAVIVTMVVKVYNHKPLYSPLDRYIETSIEISKKNAESAANAQAFIDSINRK